MRNRFIDCLKLILAFMVVGIHTSVFADVNLAVSWIATQGVFRAAVPIFFLINGYYFYVAVERKKQLTWFKRILGLYAFWMLVYSWRWLDFSGLSLSSVKEVVMNGVLGYMHLWYVAGMIGAAFVLVCIRKIPVKMQLAMMLVAFLVGVLIQYVGNYDLTGIDRLDQLADSTHLHRNFVFLAFPFFGLGFVIHQYKVAEKLSPRLVLLLVVVGVFVLMGEALWNFTKVADGDGFDNLLSLLVLCPFLFLYGLQTIGETTAKWMGQYSAAIYFVHMLVVLGLRDFGFEASVLFVLSVIGSFAASFFVVQASKRLKFVL